MKPRVTQTDIARVASVHNTTVSLALRNSRLIPDETRKRIQAIAESMGYCRDPALTALVAYRNSCRSKRQADTLAYITNWDTKWGWRDQSSHEECYQGAQKAAAQSGYNLEHFWLGEDGMSQRRMSDMLMNRGISGVLLACHRATCNDLSGIDWKRLSAVQIGCFPHFPALHQITVEPRSVVRLAMRHIRISGYRRIGLVLPQGWDNLVDQEWSKAFFAEEYLLPARERLPILFLQDPQQGLTSGGATSTQANDACGFSKWYHEHRPEVILGLSPGVLAQIRQIGLTVPRHVSYVDLFLDGSDGIAGVRHHCERMGALALEMLAAQLQQNIFGPPAMPTVTSLCGAWVDERSLPVAASPALGEVEAMAPVRSRNALAV